MKELKHPIRSYNSLAAATVTAVVAAFQYTSMCGTLSLNRAIGWDWDITHFMPWGIKFPFISMALFAVGYMLFFIAKKPVNSLLTIFHVLLTLLFAFLNRAEPLLAAWMVIGCWVIFVMNLIRSLHSGK